MPAPDSSSDSRIDRDEIVNRFYEKYPRLSRILASFRQNPLSGNTLRMIVKGEEKMRKEKKQVQSLGTPVMWERNAPIVISQYASYASEQLPQFWNSTLPDLKERYGEDVRYEHHDVPPFSDSTTEYKLATVGRAIQHQAGNNAFWVWLDHLMVGGVQSITEAYELAEELDLDVERRFLEEAVQFDMYSNVIWNDINALTGKNRDQGTLDTQQQIEDESPIFVVFVNGVQVQASYDSIVGAIEEIRASQGETKSESSAE